MVTEQIDHATQIDPERFTHAGAPQSAGLHHTGRARQRAEVFPWQPRENADALACGPGILLSRKVAGPARRLARIIGLNHHLNPLEQIFEEGRCTIRADYPRSPEPDLMDDASCDAAADWAARQITRLQCVIGDVMRDASAFT